MRTQLDARHERENHQNKLRLLLDAFERDISNRMPKYADAVKKRAREEVREPLESLFAKVESIRTSGRYTPEGEETELRLAVQAMQERLKTLRATTVEKLEGQLAEKRSAALQQRATTDPTLAVLRELRHRELRDYLRTLDPLQVQMRIRQAVSDGASTELLDALEGAPVGFPIAPAELVQEARVAIAERDHPELGELADLKRAYEYLVGTATQVLKSMTGELPADRPTPDTRKPFTVSGAPVPEVRT